MTNANGNHASSDRLDRVEQLLEAIALRQDRGQRQMENLQASQQQSQQQMEELQASQRRTQQQLDQLQQVVQDGFVETGNLIAELTVSTGNTLDEIRQRQVESDQRFLSATEEYRQRQAESDQRFYTLLEEVRYLIRKLPGPNPGEE
ncbi:hypothetical protein BST81_16650 [Leptolyngbya sp. 'hensonii']|uniref:hypothetical protein n=1 Tax=Leptolyngbya sp. 'hensonii' TaxID=1922337 RepID=UPI00094FB0FA|nr:hypothetical protein [Leptolyngbya sp. 'hensonii']OLP17421.1 hypothetical protein BST81_16650 [Leptolyngbya sp. 'hensonii']